MSHHDVTFACGHTEDVVLTRMNSKEKERRLEYIAGGLCSKCYKKQLDNAPIEISFNPRMNAFIATGTSVYNFRRNLREAGFDS